MNNDFQKVADSIAAMTCIVSVEKLPDGGCGEIRIFSDLGLVFATHLSVPP